MPRKKALLRAALGIRRGGSSIAPLHGNVYVGSDSPLRVIAPLLSPSSLGGLAYLMLSPVARDSTTKNFLIFTNHHLSTMS